MCGPLIAGRTRFRTLRYGAQTPIKQRWPATQSQLLTHWGPEPGRQYPIRQVSVEVHCEVLPQRLRQVESTQSWPAAHSAPVLQLPGARGRHSPPWQLSAVLQLKSVLQP